MSTTIQTITIALPSKIAVSIYHLNEVACTLRTLPRQLDPSTTEADLIVLTQFRNSIPSLIEQMNSYMRDIATQYDEFHG